MVSMLNEAMAARCSRTSASFDVSDPTARLGNSPRTKTTPMDSTQRTNRRQTTTCTKTHHPPSVVFGRDAVEQMDSRERTRKHAASSYLLPPASTRHSSAQRGVTTGDEGMRQIAPLIALACSRIAAMSSAQHHAAAAARRRHSIAAVSPDQIVEEKLGSTMMSHSASCCAYTPPQHGSQLEPEKEMLGSQCAAMNNNNTVLSASLSSFDAPHTDIPSSSGPRKRNPSHIIDSGAPRLLTGADAECADDVVASIQHVIEQVSESIAYGGSGRMVVVAALVYLGRLSGMCECERYRISRSNHNRTAVVCLLAATKMYIEADQSPRRINAAFAVASGIDVRELSRLEVTLLFLLDFSLIVDEPEARRWCQWLHDVAMRRGMEAPLHSFFQTNPLRTDTTSSPAPTCTPPTGALTPLSSTALELDRGTPQPDGSVTGTSHDTATTLPAPHHQRCRSGTGMPSTAPLPQWSLLPPTQLPTPTRVGEFLSSHVAAASPRCAAVPLAMASPLAQPAPPPSALAKSPQLSSAVAMPPSNALVPRDQQPRLFSVMFASDDADDQPSLSPPHDGLSPPHDGHSPLDRFCTRRYAPADTATLQDFSRLVSTAASKQPNGVQRDDDHRSVSRRTDEFGDEIMWRTGRRPPLSPPAGPMSFTPGKTAPPSGAAGFLKRCQQDAASAGLDEHQPPMYGDDNENRWAALSQRRRCPSPHTTMTPLLLTPAAK